jgi:hypothetical protein
MKQTDRIKIRGDIHGILRDKDGNIKEEFWEKNLVVNCGLEMINDLLINGTGNPITHIGIGWADPDSEPAAPAAGDINLPMPGGTPAWVGAYQDRKDATPLTKTPPNILRASVTWAAGQPATTATWPKPIRAIGLFVAGGTGNDEIFAWTRRAPINKDMTDSFEFAYTITIG